MTEEQRKMIDAVQRASQFLIDKGHRDTMTFSAPQVVDLLCEFALRVTVSNRISENRAIAARDD